MADIKKRKILKRDFEDVQGFIETELKNRETSSFRKSHESIWKEVDRQVAMQPMKKFAKNKEVDPGWRNVVELGELTRASEVITADVMRIMFPSNRFWFETHSELQAELNEETGEKVPAQSQVQERTDGKLRALMTQQHQDFGFKNRVELSIKEALHHGSFVAEAIFDTAERVYQGTGIETISAPVWQPHSMWNCFPDPSPSVIGTDNFYKGSMIIKSYLPLFKIKQLKGSGWFTDNFSKIPKRKNKNKDIDTEDVELIKYYGDFEIKRGDGAMLFLNSKVIIANGILIFYETNELPFSPIIFSGYERQDIRDPYHVSPIIKLSPMQKVGSIMANRFMDAVELKTEPPGMYDGNDAYLVQSGGPVIAPGANTPTKGQVNWQLLETGDPAAALSGLELTLRQLQSGTGVDALRSGAVDSNQEKTATEIRRTSQSSEIRTIDFVDKLERSGIRPFLYMQHELNKSKMGTYSFYNPEMGAPDFERLTKEELPKNIHFEIVGSKGVLGEEERSTKMAAVTGFLLSNPVTAQLVDTTSIAKQMYQDAGVKNPENFLNIKSPEDENQKKIDMVKMEYEQKMQEMGQELEKLNLLKEKFDVEKMGMMSENKTLQQRIQIMEEQMQLLQLKGSLDKILDGIEKNKEVRQ